jgi:hypothetical protein
VAGRAILDQEPPALTEPRGGRFKELTALQRLDINVRINISLEENQTRLETNPACSPEVERDLRMLRCWREHVFDTFSPPPPQPAVVGAETMPRLAREKEILSLKLPRSEVAGELHPL